MKRWIIRSFFIWVLLLCTVAWVGSYVRAALVLYNGATFEVGTEVSVGGWYCVWGPPVSLDRGWFTLWERDPQRIDEPLRYGLGFNAGETKLGVASLIRVPFWFLEA